MRPPPTTKKRYHRFRTVRLGLSLFCRSGPRRSSRRGRQIGIPDISHALPFSVGLLFPNLAVLAVIFRAVFHRHLVGAGQAGHVAGFRHFHVSRFPAYVRHSVDEAFPEITDPILARDDRLIRWQDNCIISVKRDGLIEILCAGCFRPCGIGITD